MQHAHRVPKRLVRLTSLCACLALVLPSLAMVPPLWVSGRVTPPSAQAQDNQGPKNDKARKIKAEPPQKGAPTGTLPNLDEVKGRREPDPEAPAALPSTMRSKRKPLESRKGKRVGNPGAAGDRVRSNRERTGGRGDRVLFARV